MGIHTMRIGIHKLGFDSIDYKPGEIEHPTDTNGMFTEVLLLISAFNEQGYNAEYADLTHFPRKNYDKIFLFNGKEKGRSNIQSLRKFCKELNYLITDTRLVTEFYGDERIDNFFAQSPSFGLSDVYNSYLHKLPIYGAKFDSTQIKPVDKRNGRLLFGGSMRGRASTIRDLLLYNHNADNFIKNERNNTDSRLPLKEYNKLLNEYSFGLVIIDPVDVGLRNITWRYYEYISRNILTFVYSKSDPNNLLLDKGSFMYISSQKEMNEKIEILSHDQDFRAKVIFSQLEKIKLNDVLGKTFTDALIEKREMNGTR